MPFFCLNGKELKVVWLSIHNDIIIISFLLFFFLKQVKHARPYQPLTLNKKALKIQLLPKRLKVYHNLVLNWKSLFLWYHNLVLNWKSLFLWNHTLNAIHTNFMKIRSKLCLLDFTRELILNNAYSMLRENLL